MKNDGLTSELKKMLSQQLYDFSDPEIAESLEHAKKACVRLNAMTITDEGYREAIEDLIPSIPADSVVCPPFHCDHGHRITMGKNVFVNYNVTMLDGGGVTIGDNVLIGPNCQIYTPNHPKDYLLRRKTVETVYPVSIGDDTWLGGGVIVCPGVKIGKRCIIAAGSVVTHDIPDDSMAAGNPAVVKKRIEE